MKKYRITDVSPFHSHIQTFATSTESHYRPKKNQTIIMTKSRDFDDDDSDDVDSRPIKRKLPGEKGDRHI